MSVGRTPATMTEIAAALGVSSATVSNALSGKGRVSAELSAKIRQAAEELGYVPSHAARALRTGRTGVIGLVLPDISNPLFPQIAQAIEQAHPRLDVGRVPLPVDVKLDFHGRLAASSYASAMARTAIVRATRFRYAAEACRSAIVSMTASAPPSAFLTAPSSESLHFHSAATPSHVNCAAGAAHRTRAASAAQAPMRS